MNQLGHSIEIATMFFILSLISERFITWFKLYFFKKGNTLFWIFFNWKRDYSVKTDDPEFEKDREQRILLLNIGLSIFIAFLVHANLFTLLHQDGETLTQLGWQGYELTCDSEKMGQFFLELFGCIFAGLLMSLGSKFWHDTLDLLFYTKNLKNKMVDKQTYKMNTLKELDDWVAATESDMIKKVFEENLAILKNIPNVISVGMGYFEKTQYIEVITTSSDTHLIPKSLPYYLPNSTVRKVEIKCMVTSPIITQSLSFKSDLTNENRPSNYGSYGLTVKFKGANGSHKMLLTCYHVVIGKKHKFNDFKFIDEENIISPHDSTTIVGTIRNAVRNNSIDAAIIDIDNSIDISNELPDGKIIEKTNPLKTNNINIEATIYGYKTKTASGRITGNKHDVTIAYQLPDGTGYENWSLKELIAISNNDKAISAPGDSGAAVLDKDNNVIGIVVAASDTHTFAIPIETIFEQLNIELI